MRTLDLTAKGELARLITELAVIHGRVTLASGKEADYYVDLRRATLHHAAAPLIGRLLRQLTADWDYVAAGGLTLGARDLALGIGVILALRHDAPVRGWVEGSGLADAGDTLATLLAFGKLPKGGRWLVLLSAGGAAAAARLAAPSVD